MSKATLKLPEENITITLPVITPTIGKKTIDVSRLIDVDLFTYDPGFVSTASCWSKITFVDGEKGILLHCGYPIEQWVDKYDYLDIFYTILNNKLPTESESSQFKKRVIGNMNVSDRIKNIIKVFDSDAPPMPILMACVSALSSEKYNLSNQVDLAINIVAKMPTIIAMIYRNKKKLEFIEPKGDLSYVENFLMMMFHDKNYEINHDFIKAMNTIFVLHADHEQNASTSTVRLAGSTGTHPYAAIVAGIGALWGPSHGGANEAVIKMLEEIGTVKNIKKYIEKAKDKEDSFRLMGFGHRVYKNTDPRATAMRKSCEKILARLGENDNKLLILAKNLEEIALSDEYFIEKKLFPNVDFYSGIVLKILDIPTDMYTPIFALARTTGWITQWIEMINDPNRKIGRPRQLYIGPKKRNLP